MAKTLLTACVSDATTVNTTTYMSFGGEATDSTSQTTTSTLFRSGGTLTGLYCRITANTIAGTSTFLTRKNASTDGNLTISIGSSATGEFEEAAPSSDTVTAGDQWYYKFVPGAATNTATFTVRSCFFEATTNTVQRCILKDAVNKTTASTTWFYPIMGDMAGNITTETNMKTRIQKSGTFKNFGCQVSANRAQTTTLRIRKDSGGGSANGNGAVSITGGGATGWYEDTGSSDTVSAGEDWNWSITTGTGTDTLTVNNVCVDYETTTGIGMQGISHSSGVGYVDNTTRFVGLGGLLANGTPEQTETNFQMKARVALTYSNLTCRVTANDATNAATIELRDDTGSTSVGGAIITAGTTGIFTDASDTFAAATADELNFRINVPTESGTHTVTISMISIWTTAVSATNYERAPATETVAIAETLARSFGATRPVNTETVSSTESITRMLAATRNPVETTNSTETLTRLLSALRPITTESTTITDAVVRVRGIPRTLSETVTSSDSVARMLAATRVLQEDTVSTETLTRLLAANRQLATETTAITDQVTRVFGAVRSIAIETVAVSDSVQRLLAATRTIQTESTTITDAVARLLAATRVISETTAITDSVVGLQQGPGQQNLTRSITETVTISESVARMLAATRTIVTETVTINDTLTRQTTATRAIDAEITSIIDTIQRSCGRVRAIATETVAVTDSVVRSVGRVRTLTENVTISDSVTRLLAATRQMLEQVSSLDSISRLLSANRSIAVETTSVSDSVTRLLTRVRTIVENIDINDAITRRFVGARPIQEIVDVVDSVVSLVTQFELPTRLRKIREWLQTKYDITDPEQDVV